MSFMDFDSSYYNIDYFVTLNGKKFRKDGTECGWGYSNIEGEWLGCQPIVKVWKEIFNPINSLDVGCGRGTFVTYERDIGIDAVGFDFSGWAVQNPYKRCKKEWLRNFDATLEWPYLDKSFDLVTALDIFEHIYSEDIDKVVKELFRVSGKWVFLQIATIGGGSGSGIHDVGYILKRGEKIPVDLEKNAVAGHVTICDKPFWIEKLGKKMDDNNKFIFRDDLVQEFIKKTPADVVSNWVKNTLIILERV
jgi:SAM-dependent methyltransferase